MRRALAASLLAVPLAIGVAVGGSEIAEAKKLARVTLPPGSVKPPPTVIQPDTKHHRWPSSTPRSRDATNAPGGVTVDVTHMRRR